MAEKQERQIIDVRSDRPASKSASAAPSARPQTASAPAKKPAAKKSAVQSPTAKKEKTDAAETHAIVTADNRKRAVKHRVGAALLWLVALGFEVLTIMLINGYLYIEGNLLTYIIIGLVADLACVVCGSQLWKKSNHIDPASEKHPVRFFLWNNMGLIASLICFVPLIIILLKEKELDEKTKKIATIIAVAAALVAGGTSVDWNPVSSEDLAAAQNDAASYTEDGTVYWTQFGKCYHLDSECQSLKNSATLYSGAASDAFEAKRSKPCSFCASEEAKAEYEARLEEERLSNIDSLDPESIAESLTEADDILDSGDDIEDLEVGIEEQPAA